MIGIGLGILVYVALATFVLWLRRRGTDDGSVSFAAVIATWLTYLVHADTVVAAAFLDPWRVPVNDQVALGAGVAVGLVGIVLFVVSTRTLLAGAQIENLRPWRLVTDGPYGRSRHPQDQAWVLLLIAVALVGRSALAVLVVLIFFWFLNRLWVHEEEQLETWFEDDWTRYRDDTPSFALPARTSRSLADTLPSR